MRWLILFLFILPAGCICPPKPVWIEIPTAEYLLAKLVSESGRYSSLDSAASVALTTRRKHFSSQQFLLLKRPDCFRADVLTGFGQLVLQLTSDGENLAVFLNNPVPGRFMRGPASYENVSRFIRIPLAVKDLLALLLHDPALIVYQRSRVEVSSGILTLILSGDDKRQELLFNEKLQLIGCRYFMAEELQLSVDYQKFVGVDKFPHKVKIEIPLEQIRVAVTFSELKINENIDVAQFRLEKPANIPVEVLP